MRVGFSGDFNQVQLFLFLGEKGPLAHSEKRVHGISGTAGSPPITVALTWKVVCRRSP